MYEVIRNINGRAYRYRQESYRAPGQKNPRTRSVYLGPVDGGIRKRKKGLIGSAIDAVREAAMISKPWEEKPEDEARRVKEETAAYAKRDHVNGLLSGESITLDQIKEVVDVQRSGELDIIPGGSGNLGRDAPSAPSEPEQPSDGPQPQA